MSSDLIVIEQDQLGDATKCACGSCDWSGPISDTTYPEGAILTPGDEVPAGRCPDAECGALCYVDEPNESAHIPGPWRIDHETGNEGPRIYSVENPDTAICEVVGSDAHAALIVAAPDLLAAAKYAVQFMSGKRSARELETIGKRLQTVIDKAEGRS